MKDQFTYRDHVIKGFVFENILCIKIPLNTKYNYFCGENGRIFKGFKELKGWKNKSVQGKYYMRYGLIMANGKRKFFYGQRLVAMTYHNLLDNPEMIVRHLTEDTFNNHKDAIKLGTHYDNNVTDRLAEGTYFNRGKQK